MKKKKKDIVDKMIDKYIKYRNKILSRLSKPIWYVLRYIVLTGRYIIILFGSIKLLDLSVYIVWNQQLFKAMNNKLYIGLAMFICLQTLLFMLFHKDKLFYNN